MKKSKSKSMSPKQILAYIAFIIGIVWTLKFVFELLSSGGKQILPIIGLVIAILWTLKFVFELSSAVLPIQSKKINTPPLELFGVRLLDNIDKYDNDKDPEYLSYISIFIEKVLDRIKVSIMGITSHQELHEIMKKIK